MKTALLTLTLIISIGGAAQARTACSELRQELQAMKMAQQQMLDSLINNHESFASSMEEYSEKVGHTKGVKAHKKISKKMDATAQAFRVRGIQGKRMANKLDLSSSDLIDRVASCLK